jgi:uncharacterized protein (TIGR03085 family)
MTIPARIEREKLCDLMLEVGPDAPTLCGDWTTRDLAAHLVVRERRPDGAVGILAKPFAGYAENVRKHEAQRDYAEIVERVRSGPPLLSPMRPAQIERFVNTIEYFVHHEDVRRGSDGWDVRELDADLIHDLRRPFGRGVKMLARKSPAGLTLHPDGEDAIVAKKAESDRPVVTVTGPLGELVLFMYGRQDHTKVDIDGPADAAAAVRAAPFGI